MPPESDDIDLIREGWAALRPDLDTEVIDIVGRVLRVAAIITRRGDEFLAGFGLTRGEFDILAALRRHGAPQTPGSLRTVALATGPATTKRLRSLEEAGLVRRAANPADGRGALIDLTPAGVDRIDDVFPRLLEVERALVARLEPRSAPAVATALRALLRSVEHPSA